MDMNNEHMAKRFRNDTGSAVRAGIGVSNTFTVPSNTGMTNYPIEPNRTPPDPIGPHRTTPHSTSYFLPPSSGQSRILSLTYTLQTRLIIDVPTPIQL